MGEILNNYSPWAEPQFTVGFCFYCKKEKILCEISEFVPDDMLPQARKSTEIPEDVKLPLVLCKICENKILQRRLDAMRNPRYTLQELQNFFDAPSVPQDPGIILIMDDIPNNYGPWLKPQSPSGYCVICKEEKTECEIQEFVFDDDVFVFEEILELDADDIHLPLVLCKQCVSDVWNETGCDEL